MDDGQIVSYALESEGLRKDKQQGRRTRCLTRVRVFSMVGDAELFERGRLQRERGANGKETASERLTTKARKAGEKKRERNERESKGEETSRWTQTAGKNLREEARGRKGQRETSEVERKTRREKVSNQRPTDKVKTNCH